jgi:hypothetical protein
MRRIAMVAGMLGALAIAGPVAANDTVRWVDSHGIDAVFTCGVVEDSTATIEGTAYFDAEGAWIKDIMRFTYDASYTDPNTGTTIEYTTRQVVVATPDHLTFLGQGAFVRAAGSGAVLLDVGRLTVDPADGSTVFRSAQALGLDDPSVAERYDEAICGLF